MRKLRQEIDSELSRREQPEKPPAWVSSKGAKRAKTVSPPAKKPMTKDEFHRHLIEIGLMSRLPDTAADFDNPEIAPMIERYMRAGTLGAKSRTELVRLLWDFLGTEFGSRHQQYEKFYGGSSSVVKQTVYRSFDFKRATALVDKALNLPPVG